jgi:hypothetical protein
MNTHMGICEDLDQNSASVYRNESCFERNLQSRKQYVLHVRYISTAILVVEEIKKWAICVHFHTYKIIRNDLGHTRTHTRT